MRRLALAALILLPLLGTAAAQLPVSGVATAVSVILVDSGKPAIPERPTLVAIQIAYTWSSGGASNAPTTIQLTVEGAPSWGANAHVEPATVTATLPPETAAFGGRAELNATLNFTAPRGAPAFQTGNFTVLAKAGANANLAASEGRGILTTRPDFVGNLTVTAPPIVATGGSWEPIPFTVTNLGNGATQVALSIVQKPEPSELELPAAKTIAVNGTALFEIRLKLPWTTGVDGTLNVTATGTSVVNPRASPVEVLAGTTVDGRSPVGAPTAGLVGLAIAIGVFVARRRR